jgi:Reverse transcriptase (RNA-dependent DNA polymerase)
VLDVETAFLYGDLEEPVYIRVPQGLNNFVQNLDSKLDCLLLKKAMYGLVQAAKQWWRKFISILVEEFKFKKSQTDVCVLTREDECGVIILCIYVDDALMVGDQELLRKPFLNSRQKFQSRMLGHCQNMLAA